MFPKEKTEVITPSLISVVLPTYNEMGNIVPLIKKIKSELEMEKLEVLVVDDNSPDKTAEHVSKEFADDKNVKVFVREKDPSLAKSIRMGIEESKGDVIIIMDTDFNHRPEYIPFMVKSISFYECVTGSRFQYGGGMEPLSRLLLSWLFNVFIRIVTGKFITDNLYGFFVIRRNVIEQYNYDDIFFGYGDYFIRLLFYLQKDRMSILQFPVRNGKRLSGAGNKAFLSTFIKYFSSTIKLIIKERLKIESQ